jgi:hypothetical protein
VKAVGKALLVYLVVAAAAVGGSYAAQPLVPEDLVLAVSLLIGLLSGAVGTVALGMWVSGPKPVDQHVLCHDRHDFERTPLHVPRGYAPRDPEWFEAQVARLREDPRFNEAAYRCMGPDRYWAAVARREARRHEHPVAERFTSPADRTRTENDRG